MLSRQTIAKIAILTLLIGVFYSDTFAWLYEIWRDDPENSHGFLLLPILGFLVWRDRRKFTEVGYSSNALGLAVILCAVLLSLVGIRAQVSLVSIFAFVLLLFGLVLYLLGTDFVRKFSFPLIYSVFLIPMPGMFQASLTFPMKLFASKISAQLLRMSMIPVLREGNFIQLPNFSFEVADACSGLRSMMALLALGALYSYFFQKSLGKRLLLFLMSVPIAIAANIFRVALTGFLAYYISPKIAEGFLHEMSGILVFFVGIGLLIGCGKVVELVPDKIRKS